MKKAIRISSAILFALIFCLSFSGARVMAGSGGGQGQALQLLAATPEDGSKDLAGDVKFELQFNKNVVNLSVKEINTKAITLRSDAGELAIDLEMADDQLDRERRDFITVVPRGGLEAGKSYVLKIDASLQAKSGDILGVPVELKYSTAAATPETAANLTTATAAAEATTAAAEATTAAAEATPAVATTAAAAKATSTVAPTDASGGQTGLSAASSPVSSSAPLGEKSSGVAGSSAVYYAVGVLLLAALAFGFYKARRKK